MQLLDVASAGTNYQHRWPDGSMEPYPSWVEYRARSADGDHTVRVAFGDRNTYGRQRRRVLVLIDGHPHAEFLGADDLHRTGDILSEIKVPGDVGERMCRYPDEVVPERYGGLPVFGSQRGCQGRALTTHGPSSQTFRSPHHMRLGYVAAAERDR